jgi:hypothetical protein
MQPLLRCKLLYGLTYVRQEWDRLPKEMVNKVSGIEHDESRSLGIRITAYEDPCIIRNTTTGKLLVAIWLMLVAFQDSLVRIIDTILHCHR